MASIKNEVKDEFPDHGLQLDQVPEQVNEQQPVQEPEQEAGQVLDKTKKLQELLSQNAPDVNILEDAVSRSLKALDSLKVPLEFCADQFNTQAPQWLKSITELQSQSKPTCTIVGVVGNTGAGKSSVISAVLDEERLLPTNCMRACTASPTEISYNHSDNPNELYRAEVEFITSDDWIKELEGLFVDLLDGNGGVSRDCSIPDSDCGVAYAKIKAVYPRKTKEMIANSTPDGMANEAAVRSVLGTTRKLRATTAASLYRQLQEYVDSKEKNTEKTIEYWPLIKVVRIYTKAAALSTGACLVDLPGVQDSNAARAAVAANYMKACTGLWIVAPITRAVDDKTAKSLLGDSFRRQLKYDGIYSAVTFICSKTDDISVTEAAESLDIEEEISESWSQIQQNDVKIRQIKKDIAELKDEKEAIEDILEANDKAWDKWDELLKQAADGETVYAPSESSPSTKKRKRRAKPFGSRKNRKSADSDSDSDMSDSDASDSDKENSQPQDENRQPLAEDEIEAKLADLKAEKKEMRAHKTQISEKTKRLRNDIKEVQVENKVLQAEVKAVCIKGRNQYSRRAIKHDFAMGIKELDQETAAEQDEENFNPDADLRDYDQVAESLPVFCVSSRAFQKLSGRLEKDHFDSSGFLTTDDTEIPQLQEHARKLTVQGRMANCRRFLVEFVQLITSMTLWATNDGTKSNLTDKEKRAEESNLRHELAGIDQKLEGTVTACIEDIQSALGEDIYELFETNIKKAIAEAVPTATGWGAPRAAGGLYWATYKALCRRQGVYSSGSAGPRDMNAELFEPIAKHLASGWERAFQRSVMGCLESFARATKMAIESFHREATKRTAERGTNFPGLNMLNQQLRGHLQRVSDLPGLMRTIVQDCQRDANRNFTPVIQQKMADAYQKCVDERGIGSFARMKVHMISHVDVAKHTMFHDATGTVREQLEDMCKKLHEQMELQVQDISGRLACDYIAVLVGTDALSFRSMPRAERLLRLEMCPLLSKVDTFFDGVGGVDSVMKDAVEENPAEEHPAEVEEDPFATPPPDEPAIIKNEVV